MTYTLSNPNPLNQEIQYWLGRFDHLVDPPNSPSSTVLPRVKKDGPGLARTRDAREDPIPMLAQGGGVQGLARTRDAREGPIPMLRARS